MVPALVTVSSVAGASGSYGTATQVSAAVKASTSIQSLPADLVPSIKLFANASSVYTLSGLSSFAACDAYNSKELALHPRPCLLGDLKSKRTIVLVGDSNVGNWTPPLSIGLKKDGYRLAVFGYSACPTSDITYNAVTDENFKECNEWHLSVPKVIRALHPVAIIAATGPSDFAGTPVATWALGMKKLFDEATSGSPSTTRIIFGTSPIYPEAVPDCLTAHADPQTCDLHFTIGEDYYGDYLSRDVADARAAGAVLVPTYPWFCTKDTCSPVIGKYLVYVDIDHVTLAYSEFLTNAVTSAVMNAISKH
jgi:hypothetical protein